MAVDSTRQLKQDHVTVRRIRDIAQKCSDKLYAGQDIPLEDIKIVAVVMEEFIDAFHHGKEEKAYFPETADKDEYFSEEIRKFLIEHEFGRRVANMMKRNLQEWQTGIDARESVARFLKTYAVFITDHTGKEDKFFDMLEEMKSLTAEEDRELLRHFETCGKDIGGSARIEELLRLIEYLEERNWMK